MSAIIFDESFILRFDTHLTNTEVLSAMADNLCKRGIVKETYTDHIIVDIPEISDHCWFENNLNMDCVYPENNFSN